MQPAMLIELEAVLCLFIYLCVGVQEWTLGIEHLCVAKAILARHVDWGCIWWSVYSYTDIFSMSDCITAVCMRLCGAYDTLERCPTRHFNTCQDTMAECSGMGGKVLSAMFT